MTTPIAGSDHSQLVVLYQEHYGSLVRLAAMLLDDVARCEEVVQDAFVKLQTTSRPPRAGKEAPWLRSVVLNACRSKLRHRLVRERAALPEPAPTIAAEEGAVQSIERREVLDIVRTLPRRQREVLALRYYLGLSEAEIAETLGLSTGSVKTHASRGLDSLREQMEAHR